jgi:hypothetical protein
MLVLSGNDARALVGAADALHVIEQAFGAMARLALRLAARRGIGAQVKY